MFSLCSGLGGKAVLVTTTADTVQEAVQDQETGPRRSSRSSWPNLKYVGCLGLAHAVGVCGVNCVETIEREREREREREES